MSLLEELAGILAAVGCRPEGPVSEGPLLYMRLVCGGQRLCFEAVGGRELRVSWDRGTVVLYGQVAGVLLDEPSSCCRVVLVEAAATPHGVVAKVSCRDD